METHKLEEEKFFAEMEGETKNSLNQRKVDSVELREAGLVTAEYAVGIVTAVAFAGLLLAIIRSDRVRQLLLNIIENALGVAF
ncbi:DUF4244 domain-containing protein [Gleimia sp. 6138-11-ORH1]|uniref:DUF4244 domain-containing protein n=1 Tax=Gleimia sp. 6138-11-ORH1 TaxID=2973937 RepID=UPI0021693180|nr:DUF4244 domain-containing protein [Gleimia sp. 6138-11-ORH1]MCS4484734.1 DUF4244 domain-containing protein [Gleimia sp. 6138-11-ORH1]